MTKLSKRKEYFSTLEERKYSISEAIQFLKSAPKRNFEESVDVSINLGIDASKSDQTVRSAISLPAGTGKPCKVAVFAEADQAKEALDAGADAVGMEDLSDKIKKGEDNFDVVIATPDTMHEPMLLPVGKAISNQIIPKDRLESYLNSTLAAA